MRTLPVLVTVLLTAALAYYVYVPLPDAIQEQWRLRTLDAALRTTMHLVSSRWRQASPCSGCSTTEPLCTNASSIPQMICFVFLVISAAFSKDTF